MVLKVDGVFGLQSDYSDYAAMKQTMIDIEALGFDGLVTTELAHDPFLPLALAADVTDTIDLRTSIAVALARNPMSLAYTANDLNAYSGGRFTLGLGSQIKAHINRRFSMPWHGAAKQMREMIQAIRAIWRCWYEDEPLDFAGEFYRHQLMTPVFTPDNLEHGSPRIIMAAVGPMMTDVAASEADGLILHSFTSVQYIEQVVLPRVSDQLQARGLSRQGFELSMVPFVVTGESEQDFQQAHTQARNQIAFYASTPAYRAILDCHGWGDLQPRLHGLSKQGKWDAMGELIDDEILHTFAVVGEPRDVAQQLHARFAPLVDRVSLNAQLPGETTRHLIGIARSGR